MKGAAPRINLVRAIILFQAASLAIAIIGLMLARDGDFRCLWYYGQALALAAMSFFPLAGVDRPKLWLVAFIAVAMACLVLDLWLDYRGPIRLHPDNLISEARQ